MLAAGERGAAGPPGSRRCCCWRRPACAGRGGARARRRNSAVFVGVASAGGPRRLARRGARAITSAVEEARTRRSDAGAGAGAEGAGRGSRRWCRCRRCRRRRRALLQGRLLWFAGARLVVGRERHHVKSRRRPSLCGRPGRFAREEESRRAPPTPPLPLLTCSRSSSAAARGRMDAAVLERALGQDRCDGGFVTTGGWGRKWLSRFCCVDVANQAIATSGNRVLMGRLREYERSVGSRHNRPR